MSIITMVLNGAIVRLLDKMRVSGYYPPMQRHTLLLERFHVCICSRPQEELRVNSPSLRVRRELHGSQPSHAHRLLAGWTPHKDISPASTYDKALMLGGR